MTNSPTQLRPIPALDTAVSPIGLGCMGISWAYVAPEDRDDEAGVALIEHALEIGITFFDTSDAYGAGHNEHILGRGLALRRDDVVLATKVGLVDASRDGRPALSRDARPEHIRTACEESLRRLGTDVIDLYYLHRVDDAVPLEESWGAMAELVEVGKVRSLGLSEVSVEQADQAHAIHPVAAVQSELSLWTRDPLGGGTTPDGAATGDMVAWTREHAAVFVPFSPLGRGFLTGSFSSADLPPSDFRAHLPRFADDAAARNQAIVDVVRSVADRRETSAAAVALAWVLAQGDHVIPIPGTTKPHHLDLNLAAAGLSLDTEDLRALDKVPAAVGARY